MIKRFRNCLLFRTDSYKFGGHFNMLKDGTSKVYSYLESRGGKFPKTLMFGLQYYLKKYLEGCVVTVEDVEQAKIFAGKHLGKEEYFNYDGWMYIATELGGKLPIEIKSVKEGSLVSTSNVLLTIENTDDRCAFVVGYIESLIMKIWYPITIATNSFYLRLLLKKYFSETSDESDSSFKMHDFGYRSVTCEEQAGIGGASHLLSFMGTDTIQGILWAMDWYDCDVCGFSVNATEHAIATPYGPLHEKEYVLDMIAKYPDGILSMIADSYDVFAHAEMLGTDPEIKQEILNRNGVYVVRPDSGDPVAVISKLLDILWKHFGGEYNSKNYKVLDKHIRIIQGDGINMESTADILAMMKANGYAVDNLVFGSGSALLNKDFDRDTQNFAFKASFNIIREEVIFVQKDPKTSAAKKSKKGRLVLHPNYDGTYTTFSSADTAPATFNSYADALELVFKNGEVFSDNKFDDIRQNVNSLVEREYKEYLQNFDDFFKKAA